MTSQCSDVVSSTVGNQTSAGIRKLASSYPRAGRLCQRTKGKLKYRELEEKYWDYESSLKKGTSESKLNFCRKPYLEANANQWGYKVAMSKIQGEKSPQFLEERGTTRLQWARYKGKNHAQNNYKAFSPIMRK